MTQDLTGICLCGSAGWTLRGDPGRINACNCTLCRRHGALWAYGHDGETIELHGDTSAWRRPEGTGSLEVRFCPSCGSVTAWRGLAVTDGRRRMAVNLRMAEPGSVAGLPVDHYDGLVDTGKRVGDPCRVRDLWS